MIIQGGGMKKKLNISIYFTIALLGLVLSGCMGKTVSEDVTEYESRTSSEAETSPESITESEFSTADSEKETSEEDENSKKSTEESETEPQPEEPAKKIIVASDIHYLSKELTDFGMGFQYMVEHGDGKVVNYIWEITDAFLEDVMVQKPEALVLSGDLTLNGELKSHEELAARLAEVEALGIPVLVIPGNHDINCSSAASYFEGIRSPAEKTTPEDFYRIYKDYGYDEAVSRDENSLSYMYRLDDYNMLLMLDSCQYTPVALVGGMVKTETYKWMEEQLEWAWNEGLNVIPVAHHNLLEESQVYADDCTIEHSEELVDLLEGWDVRVFLSGHLHVQHYKTNGEDGIMEIVTSSLATPPCQYGIFEYDDAAAFQYETKKLDMEAYARKNSSQDENLLHFTKYREPFLMRVFYNQACEEIKRLPKYGEEITEEDMAQMAQLYARLKMYYYAGQASLIADEVKKDFGYRLWDEYGYPSIIPQYIEEMLKDAVGDYNKVSRE